MFACNNQGHAEWNCSLNNFILAHHKTAHQILSKSKTVAFADSN